jgi:hypothetical protein
MGRSCYKITDPQQPHFVMLTVLHWIPVFTRPNTVDILLNTLRFLGNKGLKVYAYMVLENRCHFVMQSDEMMRQKIVYIHYNPVKRDYVDQAEHWRYSSARNYAGKEGLLEVCQQW